MRRYLQNAFGFNPFQQFEVDGQAEHGDVRERHADVQPVRHASPTAARMECPPPGSSLAVPPADGARSSAAKYRRRGARTTRRSTTSKRKLDELQSQLADLSKKS